MNTRYCCVFSTQAFQKDSRRESVVAGFTIAGRWFVKDNSFAINISRSFVTFVTLHFRVRALQRKIALFFVIEMRRLPMIGIVTVVTLLGLPFFHKLTRMRILVASSAICRRGAE